MSATSKTMRPKEYLVEAIRTANGKVTYVGSAILEDGTLDSSDRFKLDLNLRKYEINDRVSSTEKGLIQFKAKACDVFHDLHRGQTK
ncbi:MAG: hypothetical protein M1569_02385 [Candidatus Marsarchaeota archaeon]|nr:hypothetical protein [Candidatus Marsarchaeota archaeon]MCL5413228.1 hypothetical protein [Candidatus Marsarchaeota archaeon]